MRGDVREINRASRVPKHPACTRCRYATCAAHFFSCGHSAATLTGHSCLDTVITIRGPDQTGKGTLNPKFLSPLCPGLLGCQQWAMRRLVQSQKKKPPAQG